jgi:hypothetical protein
MYTFEDLIDCDDNILTQIFSHLKAVDLLSLKRVNHHLHTRIKDDYLFYCSEKIEDIVLYFLKRGRDQVILELITNQSYLINKNSYRLIVSYADKHKNKDMTQLIRQLRPDEHFPTQLNSQVIQNFINPIWFILDTGNDHSVPHTDQKYVFLRELCQLFINCSCSDNIHAFTTNHNLLKCHDPMFSWRLFSLDELNCFVNSRISMRRKHWLNASPIEPLSITLILDGCYDEHLIEFSVFKYLAVNNRNLELTLIIITNSNMFNLDSITRSNTDRVTILKGLNWNQFNGLCHDSDRDLFEYYRMITNVDNWFTLDETINLQSNNRVTIGCGN